MINKQEAIEKIENLEELTILDNIVNFDSAMTPKKEVLNIVNQIDEPEKPIVPQFVADWYEDNKDEFEYNLYRLCIDFYGRKLHEDLHEWFDNDKNKPIEVLVLMNKYGYEVEKEKLYTVELPNPNGDSNRYGLCKVDGRIIIGSFVFGLNKASNAKLTEAEIKKDFDWAWQFAEEVEE